MVKPSFLVYAAFYLACFCRQNPRFSLKTFIEMNGDARDLMIFFSMQLAVHDGKTEPAGASFFFVIWLCSCSSHKLMCACGTKFYFFE